MSFPLSPTDGQTYTNALGTQYLETGSFTPAAPVANPPWYSRNADRSKPDYRQAFPLSSPRVYTSSKDNDIVGIEIE